MKRFLVTLILLAWLSPARADDASMWAEYWADAYRLPGELVKAVIEAESGWNARAISPAGAAGLMQLMPETAVAFHVRNRFDPAENVRGGVAYLASLRNQCGGDWRLILASYAAGPRRVLRQGLNFDSQQVRRYVERVAHLYRRNCKEAARRRETGEPR